MNWITKSVHEGTDNVRLDRALSSLFPEHSRNYLARLIEQGHVSVDTKLATKTSLRVSAGQSIRVEFPPPAASRVESQEIPLTILFEDENIVVINKPPGLVVHPAAGHADQTLVNALLFHIKDLSGVGGELRPGIVHRLDKDTSGVMVIAKSDRSHRALAEAWGTDRVRKEYLALVYGTPAKERGTIDTSIGRDLRNRKRMTVTAAGRRAVTDYEIVERLRYVSLLRCTLRTGRTHQIRVHLKHLGHPIVGDPVYSGPQWKGIPDQKVRHVLAEMKRQALHASRITIDGRVFEAPLAEDIASVISRLR
ncbi:MAG TPA: RluA family pseudouridine synthase [Thermoanaerobaculia bacterium]|nr:RluA family pseudouridine synthase [Thermoanaerobaculia bacterium]